MNFCALRWQATLLALLSFSISGCTTTASRASDSRDPLEPINRVAHQFNEDLDRALLRPVARGYHRVVPEPVLSRSSIGSPQAQDIPRTP